MNATSGTFLHGYFLQSVSLSTTVSRYVYWWADGIHTGLWSEHSDGQCLMVIVGITPDGKKERVAIGDGYRESKESWKELLLDLKQRGLQAGSLLAAGDGAMGFWAAIEDGVSEDKTPAVLVPQDGQCAQRATEIAAWTGKGGYAGDLDGIHSPRGSCGV